MTTPINQLISGAVDLFFLRENRGEYTAEQIEAMLLARIDDAILNENSASNLKGALANRPIKVLPPDVIARCVMERDLPHLGLLGDSVDEDNATVREKSQLVSYVSEGANEDLYMPAETLVRKAARQYSSRALKRDLDEVIGWIRDYVPMLAPSENDDIVALANGLFNLRTKELTSFSPHVVLSSKCEARWDPNATVSPTIDGWDVDSWIGEITDEDPEIQTLLWQVIAAIFHPDHAFDKAILLVSENGSNGKGTFLELLRSLVGRHRVATVSLADFDRQFMPIQLASSFAVLSDENSVGSFLKNSQNLKAWVTHDWITLDRKNRNAVQIKGRGLSVFCLNELPQSQDKTKSLYRRFVPVPFKRRYMGSEKNPLIKSDYLKRPEVLDYVARKALSMPLFDAFDVPRESDRILNEIRRDNDLTLQFVEEFFDQFVWGVLPWKFLYALYLAWMKASNPSGKAVGYTRFIKQLTSYVKEHPECGWVSTEHPVKPGPHMTESEPLAVEYGLVDWTNMGVINGQPMLVGLPRSLATTIRGLVRSVSSDIDDNDDGISSTDFMTNS